MLRSIEGTYDVVPGAPTATLRPEAWRFVEGVLHEVMGRFGFERIRTPVLEHLELFARGVGQSSDIVSKEMFQFERGRNRYVMRPELTAPVMRAYLQHHLDQRPGVARLYYIGPCFRAERPQKGRYRQFFQFGAEIIGTSDVRADTEVIAAMMTIYEAIGLEGAKLRLHTLGDTLGRKRYVAALREFLAPHVDMLSSTSRSRLQTNPLRILDTKLDHERRLLEEAPRLLDYVSADAKARYEEVKGLLTDLKIPFVEDSLLVRGLDYYSHTAFELEAGNIGAQKALAGGGRYDGLAESMGSSERVPAVGFAAGIERLFLALQAQGWPDPRPAPPDVFLVTMGPDAGRWAVMCAKLLRATGLRCVYDLATRSIRAQLRQANRSQARHAVIVTEVELQRQVAGVKNMQTGIQESVPFASLGSHLQHQET